ncbi:MAG: S-methyl-5-thioribose-1-phosphate isomerase [Bacteroidetes bacterium]|nr:S-methyl-5-thioribose-1-phosphate isomerase [Bacteroidota bacterium]
MKVNGLDYRAVWMEKEALCMIDQRVLPFRFDIVTSYSCQVSSNAIRNMTVRGAGTIGATAGYAMAQAFRDIPPGNMDQALIFLEQAKKEIENTRPTARDLFFATDKVYHAGIQALVKSGPQIAYQLALAEASSIADAYVFNSRMIGVYGNEMIPENARILTHCNAGWLALVDYGSALSPVYVAFKQGKNIKVWVDETRPRSQGAKLTAWELSNQGIPHTIIPDNAAAYLMSKGLVDLVITGADRIAVNGDAANKIGTLEKAILAKEYGIPFYIAAPLSTFDPECPDGDHITIEERDQAEVLFSMGPDKDGEMHEILTCNPGSQAFNPAFDVTPARLIKGYFTEQGIKTL